MKSLIKVSDFETKLYGDGQIEWEEGGLMWFKVV